MASLHHGGGVGGGGEDALSAALRQLSGVTVSRRERERVDDGGGGAVRGKSSMRGVSVYGSGIGSNSSNSTTVVGSSSGVEKPIVGERREERNLNNQKIRPNTTNDLLLSSSSIAHNHFDPVSQRVQSTFSFDDQSDSSSDCNISVEKGSVSINRPRQDSSSNALPITHHYPASIMRLGSPSRSRAMAAFVIDNANNDGGDGGINGPGRVGNNTIRPRAPRSKLKTTIVTTGQQDTSMTDVLSSSVAPAFVKKGQHKSSNRKPKATNISELLDNLQHFDKTNMSRSLTKNDQDEIHYVNLDSKKVAVMAPTLNLESPNASAYFKASRHKKPAPELNLASFSIPELPSGKTLTFNILSTWGDPHYVGLMGIEIFDKSGHLVRISYPDKQIWADPPDINILPEYGDDPRTVDNIVDGINLTCDDLHAWLAPFTSGENHFLFIEFDEITTISMIRIWNYNKSRIHSHRGARYVEIMLDDRSIFKGEIKQAPGIHSILKFEDCCECILFTRSNNILMLIEKYDPVLEEYNAALKEFTDSRQQQNVHRPVLHSRNHDSQVGVSAGSRKSSIGSLLDDDDTSIISHVANENKSTLASPALSFDVSAGNGDNRPSTRAGRVQKKAPDSVKAASDSSSLKKIIGADVDIFTADLDATSNKIDSENEDDPLEDSVDFSSLPYKMTSFSSRNVSKKDNSRPSTASIARRQQPCLGRYVDVCVLSCWGNQELTGVTSFSGVDEFMNEFVLPVPKVLIGELFKNDMGGYELKINEKYVLPRSQMSNAPDIIVCGHTQTNDQRDMWSALKPQKGCIVFRFDLKRPTHLKGLKVWNFNASGEDALVGMKHVQLYIDGIMLSSVLIRKAPGVDNVDYAQFLPLVKMNGGSGLGLAQLSSSSSSSTSTSSSLFKNPNSKSLANLLESIPNIKESGGSSFYSLSDRALNDVGGTSSTSSTSSNKNSKSVGGNNFLANYNWTNNAAESAILSRPPNSPDARKYQQSLIVPVIQSLCPVPQQYETPVHPCGCMIKVVINSTHGDRFYVGLNGIEIYDEKGFKVDIDSSQIQAFPYKDINDLEEIRKQGQDVRTLLNLINPINNTFNDRYMWLAPFAGPNSEERNRLPNSILIMLDEPMSLSCVKIWNYSKTPNRGAKEVEVFLDDGLIFRGNLLASPSKDDLQSMSSSSSSLVDNSSNSTSNNYSDKNNEESINWGSGSKVDLSQVILFTDKEDIIAKERCRVPMAVDDIEFIDEGRSVKSENISRLRPDSIKSNVRRPMTTSTGRLDKGVSK